MALLYPLCVYIPTHIVLSAIFARTKPAASSEANGPEVPESSPSPVRISHKKLLM